MEIQHAGCVLRNALGISTADDREGSKTGPREKVNWIQAQRQTQPNPRGTLQLNRAFFRCVPHWAKMARPLYPQIGHCAEKEPDVG